MNWFVEMIVRWGSRSWRHRRIAIWLVGTRRWNASPGRQARESAWFEEQERKEKGGAG